MFQLIPLKSWLIGGLAALFVLLLGGWGLYRLWESSPTTLDLPIREAFKKVPGMTSYSQYIETTTSFPERKLRIEGIYTVDLAHQAYSSFATTTLYIEGDPAGHSFTNDNISVGTDIYSKIETNDPLLKKSIKNSPQWSHFTNDAIPDAYKNIAIWGPIEENMALLGQNGAYLSLIRKHGLVKLGSESLLQYTFRLSSKPPSTDDGALTATLERIATGTVDVWIDPTLYTVRYLRFENDPYVSTTTISQINALPPILPPKAR